MPPEWAAKPRSSSDCMSRITSVNSALMRLSMPSRCFFSSSSIVNPPLSRSEEHTSELQSLRHLVCRLLLETTQQTSLFKPLGAFFSCLLGQEGLLAIL